MTLSPQPDLRLGNSPRAREFRHWLSTKNIHYTHLKDYHQEKMSLQICRDYHQEKMSSQIHSIPQSSADRLRDSTEGTQRYLWKNTEYRGPELGEIH